MLHRFRIVAGAAHSARATGSVEAARRYCGVLRMLVAGSAGDRPEIAEAKTITRLLTVTPRFPPSGGAGGS